MVESLTYTYTTEAEIDRLLGATNTEEHADLDNDGTADTGVIQDAIDEATDWINMYCLKWYEASDLADNLWVRRAATYYGAFKLSMEMALPANYMDMIARYESILERIFAGTMQIPRVPTRADMTPALSNLRIDERFARNKIRVEGSTSTGGVSSRTDYDHETPDML